MAMMGPKGEDGSESDLFADINITPLTDIFLVLLIIFMVTSSVMATDGGARRRAREPAQGRDQGDLGEPEGRDGRHHHRRQDGRRRQGGQRRLRLRKMFDDARARDPETQVVVQADEATHHGRVVAVMELAKAAGLRRLAIATRRR